MLLYLIILLNQFNSRDSSVGIATEYRLEVRGSIPGKDKRFSLLYIAHTVFAPLSLLPIGHRVLFPRG
jgi:hypothetical protein